MEINSVVIATYDVNMENQLPRIESMEVPMLYLFPAYHKEAPFHRYLGSPTVSEMANFIKANADIEFEMSMDLAQYEQFMDMRVKQMAEEQSRKDQMQMIEDELRRRGEL